MTRKSSLTVRWLLTGALLVLAALLLLILQSRPAVGPHAEISTGDTRRLEQLIVDNSPARFRSTDERSLSFSEAELNLLSLFVSRNFPQLEGWTAEVRVRDQAARVRLSKPWPAESLPLYLNLELRLAQDADLVRIDGWSVGDLPLPAAATGLIANLLQLKAEGLNLDYQEIVDLQESIQRIELREGQMDIDLQWEPRLLTKLRTQARQLFISAEDRDRILHYYARIARLASELPEGTRRTSLHTFLPPLFQEAEARSTHGDPVAENRTLLQALSLYVNYLPLEQLISDVPEDYGERPPRMTVVLQQRNDLTQHFVASAAIAASAGADVAGVLSNSKEAHDARYRSGFDFADMIANAAGMALGSAAAASPDRARDLQSRMAQSRGELDYMPAISEQDTAVSEEVLAEEYNNRAGPDYEARMQRIEQQVSSLPLHQPVR